MNISKLIFSFWAGTTIAGSLDLLYQFLFTPTVEWFDTVSWIFAVTVMCAMAGVIFLEEKEKEDKKSRISELENRVEKLESKIEEVN